jgi:hypothetical protein
MMHPQLCFMGDGAYTNDSRILIPYARNQLHDEHGATNAGKLQYNLLLRSQRVLVEWTIGRLRQAWHVLHAPFRMDRGRADELVFAAAILLNFMFHERGTFVLRSPAAMAAIQRTIPVRADDIV